MLWVSIEGPDGAGKSTLMQRLAGALGCVANARAFPTGFTRGRITTARLLGERESGIVEMFLNDIHESFTIARRRCGPLWLTDRGPLSTLAYCPEGILYESTLRDVVDRKLFVDVVFYVDVAPEICVVRQEAREGRPDLGGHEGDITKARQIARRYNVAITDYAEACIEAGNDGPDVVVLRGDVSMDALVTTCLGILAARGVAK